MYGKWFIQGRKRLKVSKCVASLGGVWVKGCGALFSPRAGAANNAHSSRFNLQLCARTELTD